MLGDVNGDGRADIVAFGTRTWVALGRTDGTFESFFDASSYYGTESGWTTQSTMPRLLGDINGDGLSDIVGFASDGVYVSLATTDADTLRGGEGNDTLQGGPGGDVLDGGAGTDFASYAGTFASVHVDLALGVGTAGDARGDILIGIENLEGGSADDILKGDGNDNLLKGADGADVLDGRGGNDTLDGGVGADTLIGGSGNDIYIVDQTGDLVIENIAEGIDEIRTTLFVYTLGSNLEILTYTGSSNFSGIGNDGDNIINGGNGADTLNGGLGIDTLVGGDGNDTYIIDHTNDQIIEGVGGGVDTVRVAANVYGLNPNIESLTFIGSGNFFGTGNASANTIIGGTAADTLDGGAGADTLIGGAGNDVYAVDDLGDVVIELAGEGIDEVRTTLASYTLAANVENLTFIGSGAFTGTGNGLANVIQGGTGNDTLDGGAGTDTLRGGAGNDTYLVSDAADFIVENAGEGTDEVRTGLTSYTLAANVENLVYTGGAAFIATGNTGNNLITGGAGNDSLTGDAGNDTLDGGTGADTLVGGTGNDTYIVDNTGDVITELAGQGTDTVRTGLASYTLGANVENLVFTGSGPVTFTGNALNNSLAGGAGADLLSGLDGNDTLNGGAGADTLIGGTGNDTYVVDNIGDVLVELPGEGTDTVQSSISHTLLADFENLTLTGSAAIAGTGNAANNLLTGNGAANVLSGLAGDDTLNGGGGADTLVGGTGNDLYVVDNAGDSVVELADEGTDTVNASVSWMLGANVENLTLTGSGAINATGNDLGNVLTGNSGANVLDGGLGADNMAGGAGDDVYIVDDAGDLVTELAGQGTDEVRTSLSVYALGANVERMTYTGGGSFSGAGNGLDNLLTGGAGDDTLIGGAGNDTLAGGLGTDSLAGGLGDDVYLVDGAGGQVIELAGEGWDEVRTGLSSYSLTANVEALTFSGAGTFAGTGNDLDNRLVGGIGSDTLSGGSGTDTLDGGAGGDLLIGGFGDDLYIVDSPDDQIVELLGEGIDEVRTALAGYTLTDGVEILTYTGLGSFSGDGNGLDNRLQGGAGADTLDGGAGNDTLIGGLGDDVYRIDSVGDVVVETADGGIDEVRTTLSVFTLGDNVERLLLQGGAGLGIGNMLDNALVGGSGNDSLEGWFGNDTLSGGLGDDLLTGGEGADLFVFATGDGQDLITDFDALLGDRIGVAADRTYTVTSDINGDARIVFGTSDALTLAGVQASAVSASWFVTV